MGESPGVVVAPRVLSELSGDPLPLVDVVEPYLGRVGAIALVGTVGSGKSTALLAPAERFRQRRVQQQQRDAVKQQRQNQI